MNAIPATPNNFLTWCVRMLGNWILVEENMHDGYYLKLFPEALEGAYRWNASRYNEADSLNFITDAVLDNAEDEVAAKMLRELIDSAAGKALRDHVATRMIEYYKPDLVKLAAPDAPSRVRRYAYPLLRQG